MTDERPIIYEPHPVTPERKAELIAQGFRIIDAIFDPAITDPPLDEKTIDDMQRAEIVAKLKERGLTTTGKIEALRERLKAAQ